MATNELDRLDASGTVGEALVLAAMHRLEQGDATACEKLVAQPPFSAGPTLTEGHWRKLFFDGRREDWKSPCCRASECVEPPIRSHLIHQAAQSSLAENGQVVTFSYADQLPTSVKLGKVRSTVRPISRNTAFAGFCAHHDDRLFSEIDNWTDPSDVPEAAHRLWGLRTVAAEMAAAEKALAMVLPSCGKIIACSSDVAERRRSMRTVRKHLLVRRASRHLIQTFESRSLYRKQFVGCHFVCEQALPFCFASFSSPRSAELTRVGDEVAKSSDFGFMLALVPVGGRSVLLFACPTRLQRVMAPVWRKWRDQVASASLFDLLCFAHSTGRSSTVSPRWWNLLATDQQQRAQSTLELARERIP